VWVRFKITGTTVDGKKVELASVNIFRIVNGKVAEGWTAEDMTAERDKVWTLFRVTGTAPSGETTFKIDYFEDLAINGGCE
jgi:hypothetical protein